MSRNPPCSFFRWARAFAAVAQGAALALAAAAAQAEEPARQFLDGLRERGYHDVALDYLERMKDSPLAPVELREIYLYEQGATLIQASREQRDMAIRASQLDEAQSSLENFIRQHSDHDLASAAASQLGNVIVERARMKVEDSKKGDKLNQLKQARELYDQAFAHFSRMQNDLYERLAAIPKFLDPEREKRRIEQRDQLRADYLQAQLLAAAIREEMCDTIEEGSDEYKKLLTEAGEAYGGIYDKYRTRLAGLYARMYQGRVNQRLGNFKDALSYYQELLEQPDEAEAFRILKTKTMKLAMQCWLDASQKKYAAAADQCGAWIKKARGAEVRAPEWIELRLQLARAHKLWAEELEQTAPKDPQIKLSRSEAVELATFVTRNSSEFEEEARQLLVDLGRVGAANTEEEPKTFVEAKDAGKKALDAIQTASLIVRQVPPQIARESDEQAKAELQKTLDEAQQTLKTAQADARRYFQMALQFADAQTDLEELNIVRYFLCYLYYSQADYFDAAVTGEFVARRFPGSSGARQCAKIALAAYLKLYGENKSADKSYESDRVVGIASYIADQWSDQAEAVEALATLIPFMIKADDLEQALAYLNRIPTDSPSRGDAELKTGQAIWAAYLRGMQDVRALRSGGGESPEAAEKEKELLSLRERAEATLAEGVARMRAAGEASETLTTAVLSLAQVYVDTDQAGKAIALLNDPDIGALALVEKGHPATSKEGFALETYKTALRAYISSLAGSQNSEEVVARAKAIMEKLDQATGDSAEGRTQLVGIYVSLARDLEEQIKNSPSAEAQGRLTAGFDTFLSQVGAEAEDLNVLNWVAETFYSMGAGYDDDQLNTPADAQKFYSRAVETYERILSIGAQRGESWLPEQMKTQIRMRMAMAQRRLGKFVAAMDNFVDLLTKNNMMLNVQVEAARTYQMWGAHGNEELYNRAIKGAKPDSENKNVVWGWGRLAQIVARYPEHRDTFHEARFNLALSRFYFAQAQKSAAEKQKYLEMAQRDIELTKKLYPDLGGEKWEPKYNQLLRNVQSSLKN